MVGFSLMCEGFVGVGPQVMWAKGGLSKWGRIGKWYRMDLIREILQIFMSFYGEGTNSKVEGWSGTEFGVTVFPRWNSSAGRVVFVEEFYLRHQPVDGGK